MNVHADMSQVIIPKSDQINADDLIAGPMTVTIQEVKITPGSEQPVNIVLEGTEKFYRPCKSMSRVLVGAWGADASKYVGRSLTLYRDPEVKWGGLAVGGIRISHMSHLDGAKTMVLTATKGSRKPFKVLPLAEREPRGSTAEESGAQKWANGYIAKLAALGTIEAIQTFGAEKAAKLAELQTARPDLHAKVAAAVEARIAALGGPASFDDDFDEPAGPDNEGETEREPDPRTNDLLGQFDAQGGQQEGADPAAAKCNELIGLVKQCTTSGEITRLWGVNAGHIEAMDEGLLSALVAVKDARLGEIKAGKVGA